MRWVAVGLVATAFVTTGPARADELQDVSKLVSSGKLDEGEKRADDFLAKTPKDAQMRFLKGVILAQRGRRDDAVALFTAITQDFPELPEPYNNMAVIYAAQGQYDKARVALETAVRVSPNYATAHENLGDVYAALAARAYQEARRNDAGNAPALRKLEATRAMLSNAPTPTASSAAPAGGATASGAAVPASPSDAARSQRNVGLPSPAGPRVTVGGFGAAPEIVVSSTTPTLPQGSNIVAIEESPATSTVADTSVLNGTRTSVAADPAQPVAEVTAAVRRWAADRSVTADDVRVRIDGDTAVARFRETAKGGRKPAVANRALTLRRNGAAWTVTDARVES